VIDKVDEVDLFDTEESHAFGNIYECILKDLQGAGNAGEFYTPRAVTDFIIKMLDPKLGEVVGDFAMGTGGFLVSALNFTKPQIMQSKDMELWQHSIIGQEWKPFPYLLGVTNILLHGIKEPMVHHMDSLSHPMSDYEEDGKLNTIAMNPPFGGATDAATIKNFKAEYRSSETADLFMVLIMQRLAENGRAGVVLPDGFLFGTDGPKFAIKKRLLTEFNLHTIVRLPTSVFAPYTSIATNILFFDNAPAEDAPEGYATKETWFYRLDMPEGYKHFSKTKRILPEHFNPVREWWNNRRELEDGAKSCFFTPQEMIEDLQCNFDQCKFPKEEEDILAPGDLITNYKLRRKELDIKIDRCLAKIESMLGIKTEEL
jgi:type I restriction enzyme M protein